MSKLNSLLAASILLGCVATVDAGTLADIAILDRNTGERLQTWRHEGRLYVAGQPGNRYAVELKSRGDGRLLAVLSVDGVNAITGQTAATSQSGYVLDAWQKATIQGWRKNLDDVAAFYFTPLADAYAARTGRPDNVGVIGVALYREYREYRDPGEYGEYSQPPVSLGRAATPWSRPAPSAKAAASASGELAEDRSDSAAVQPRAAERLGTGHGERLTSTSRYTDFRRASDQPAEIIAIHYDSRANLVAKGVIPTPRRFEPRPFPGGFVADPG